jgi:hypothetical protein
MIKVNNVEIFKNVIICIYEVALRRTSKKFATAVLNTIVRTLE